MAQLDRLLVRIEGDSAQLSSSLARAQQDVSGASTRMQASLTSLGASTRRLTPILQQAGFQVGDFAVQIASGTPFLRAFIQQGSQMAGAFGPWGAVIGAAGAVIGALTTQMDLFGDSVDTTGLELGRFEDQVKKAQSATELYQLAIEASNDVLLTNQERAALAADENARLASTMLRVAMAAKVAERAQLEQRLQTEIQFRIDEARRQAAADPRAGLANIYLGQGTGVLDEIRSQIEAIDAAIKDAEERLNRIAGGVRGEGAGGGAGGGGRSRGGGAAGGGGLPLPPHKPSLPADPKFVIDEAGQSLEDFVQTMADVPDKTDDGTAALRQLGQTLSGLVTGAMDAKSALGSIINFLFQQLEQGLSGGGGLFGSLFGSGGLAGLFNFGSAPSGGGMGLSFGGLYAEGGRIGAREFGIVGERGPELVRGPAVVTPMSRAGTTVFIDARGADRVEFERVRRELRALNASVEERAVSATMDARARGGRFAQTFR